MNELMIFENAEFGKVRTMTIENEPWFVGKDVAEILGYERGAKAIQDHVDSEDKDAVPIQDSIGRMQDTPVINESGLYSLILSSKLPTAKKFKHWVTSEVLPAIRKTGSYSAQLSPLEILAAQANALVKQEKQMKEISERQKKTEQEIQGMRAVVSLSSASWRCDTGALINRIAKVLGGNEHIQPIRKESYKLLNERMGVALSVRLINMRCRMADEGVSRAKRDKMNYLDVIDRDKKLIEGYVAIIKEMAIKYGAHTLKGAR